MTARPWPDIPEEHRWTLELMEERLQRTNQSPDQLRARANELRTQASSTEIKGFHDAALALADRYDEAAATRC